MKFGRHSAILALVRDRFIIVMGGMIQKSKSTQLVSAFDSEANAWFDMKNLETPRVNCSAVVLNQRYIYVISGSNPGTMKVNGIALDYMDTGNLNDFNSSMIKTSNGSSPM